LLHHSGPLTGREAIQKFYTDVFQQWHPTDSGSTLDGNAFHLIGTAGNEAWATGEWNETGQGKNGEPITIKGYWSNIYVREGDDWKIRVDTWNMTPAATPSPTASPSSQ
jgi:ketosteroid isomerase-like protein